MLTRRYILRSACCAACAALAGSFGRSAWAAEAPREIAGPGYRLHFVGAQRETVMMGRRRSLLDLRSLQGAAHLFGIGPIEGLTGEVTILDGRPSLSRVARDGTVEVTESFEAGVPFFVWAEVTGTWRSEALPAEIRSAGDLERFVADAAGRVGLVQAFPFVVSGRASRVGYHILDAPPGSAHPTGMAAHEAIQKHFELAHEPVTLVGFHSRDHRGIFTPMSSNMHVHFQDAANTRSGHVETLDLGGSQMSLALPAASE